MCIHKVHKNKLFSQLAFVFILFFAVHFSVAFANSIDSISLNDFTDEDFFGDLPAILTVSRLEQPTSETPASVSVIDREMIKASGARELADIFRLIPGFIVGNIEGNRPVVTYHGLGYNYNRQLQVLIDGRSVFIPSFGGIPWSSLPVIIEDIEKVEVTRGPNATSYGSNSFLAVINIITRTPAQDTGANYAINYSPDNTGVKDQYFSYAHQYNDIDWKISAKNQADEGFEPFDSSHSNHDSKDVSKFNLSIQAFTSPNTSWSFQLGQSQSKFDRGNGKSSDIFRQEDTTNSYQSIIYEASESNASTKVNFFHTTHDVNDSFPVDYEVDLSSIGLGTFFLPSTVDFSRFSERTEIEVQRTLELNEQLRLVFGGSYRKDTVDSFFLLGTNNKQNIDMTRLFSNVEYKIDDNKIINIGTMLEDSETAGSSNSPRLAYIQHLNKKHTIRTVYSKAYRNPILFETNGQWAFDTDLTPLQPAFDFTQSYDSNNNTTYFQTLSAVYTDPLTFNTSNSNLKPEELDSYEIGINSHFSPQLETDIKIYEYKIKNQIDLTTNSDGKRYYINKNNTTSDGIELSLSYKPNLQTFFHSGLNLNTAKSNSVDYENSFPSKTLFFLSSHDINKQHTVSGAYYYISKMEWLDLGSKDKSIQKLDLRYAYTFNQNLPLSLELIGQNLLKDYTDYVDHHVRSASYFVRLKGSF